MGIETPIKLILGFWSGNVEIKTSNQLNVLKARENDSWPIT